MLPRPAYPVLLMLLAACGGTSHVGLAGDRAWAQWQRAQQLWRERDQAAAYRAWLEIDPGTPEGQEARRLLREADAHYRRGIGLLLQGRPGAREALLQGVAVAPMDPALYLDLARACRDRGLSPRAADFYRRYLALLPEAPEAEAARRELRALDPELSGIFDSPVPSPPRRPVSLPLQAALLLVGAAAAVVLSLGVWWWRRRPASLAQLLLECPELHPAIAYLTGRLRHEFLKHRIGAVDDAMRTLSMGRGSPEQSAFLQARLYGGEPLRVAWEGHLRAFERALGPRSRVLRADRSFREADRRVAQLSALQEGLRRGEAAAGKRLLLAHERLHAFDRELAALLHRLARTTVDTDLLREVVGSVQGEYAAGQVALDELRIAEVPSGPADPIVIEVYRIDLLLVLKNVVRNAILAAGRGAPPRRVGLDVRLDLLPTGEEIVWLRVRDSSPEPLSTEAIYEGRGPRERRLDRGLGIVTAALSLYDGAIAVETGSDGYAKGVALRFFRAFASAEGARA